MKYAIATLGCKVNQFESHALELLLSEKGFTRCDSGADVIIVNTCAVTAESVRKSRQAVRRLQSENPGALTAVCGCFSQLSPEEAASLGADILYGSGQREQLAEDIAALLRNRGERVRNVDDPFRRRFFEALPPGAPDSRTRAYIKIQDGCDNFCAYCAIPYARGRVRSMPLETAVEQASGLSAQGYRELVLTGIEIASYGKDFQNGAGLIDAIEKISAAAPDSRLRLGSLEPRVVTEDFGKRLVKLGNICAHFHLSLQSGCDRTLKAMGRKYDTARFLESAEALRRYFPGCGLTADMICGFPGETEEDHAVSLAFIRRCGFSAMHIFPYSLRPGTAAAKMPGQLPRAVKERRAAEAKAAAEEMRQAYLENCVGKTLSVLFERENGLRWRGHGENYCLVSVPGENRNLRGQIHAVKITGAEGTELTGEIGDSCAK